MGYLKGRRYALLFLILICTLALPACGERQSAPETEDNVLIYAALNPVTDDLRRSIKRFNENHEDVRIEIWDYSDEGGRERLQTELVLGQVPDIMELRYYGKYGKEDIGPYTVADMLPGAYSGPKGGYFMPYRQLAQRGYLEDLWPYIENDPDLEREAVLEAPLKAAEVNGGLYMLFEKFVVFTLMGRESVVGDRYSWTLEDMMEVYAAMPEGSTILRYNMTKREVFYNLLCNSLERFVDREGGETTFDSEEFRDLVGFLEMIPDEAGYENERETEEEIMRRIKNGTQMLEGMMVAWSDSPARADSVFRERVSFVGYPTADGSSGSFFYLTDRVLGMSSVCRNKDAAWEYIRQMIVPMLRKTKRSVLNSTRTSQTPVNLNDYEAICWYDLDLMADYIRRYPDDPLGHFIPYRHFRYGPDIYLWEPISKEHFQRHRELIDHTTQLYWPEDALSDIVWETLGAYFAGDRTLDDTIRLIDNRVGLYLKEQQ